MKNFIKNKLLESGAVAVGFARAGELPQEVHTQFQDWLDKGFHGEMAYLQRHLSLRSHTDSVLPGAATVISLAFCYAPAEWPEESQPKIAAYAYGQDYHNIIRERLQPVIAELSGQFGGKWRLCIDSAPVPERYYAIKSGIAKRGLNGSVIVDGSGSFCFLAEILTTLSIDPDTPSQETCAACGLCLSSCPANALRGDGTVDSRLCINYLTIEKKTEFTEEEKLLLKRGQHLYGCDTCLRVCPHNQELLKDSLPEFNLSEEIKNLSPETVMNMTEEEFKRKFRKSPLLYAGYSRLYRNAKAIKKEEQ